MFLLKSRVVFSLAFLGCVAALFVAYGIQHGLGVKPCALCYLQRFIMAGFALVCLLAAVHDPGAQGRRVYAGICLCFTLCGLSAAGRQLWLQSLTPEQLANTGCLPGFDYMLGVLPVQELLKHMVMGTAECGEISWTFLSLSIPEWSFMAFVIMGLFSLYQLLHRSR